MPPISSVHDALARGEANKTARLANIDLLRAIAIVAVMLYHYTARFPIEYYRADEIPFRFTLGHYGVELFFVVSGFCILMTMETAKSLSAFWAKRLARIQPAYMVGITITLLVLLLFPLPGRETTPLIALSNAFWFNLIPSWPMVDGAYWSLVVELKFYFWLGVIYYLVRGHSVSCAWAVFSLSGAALELAAKAGLPLGDALGAAARLGLISQFAPVFLVGILAYEAPRLGRFRMVALMAIATALLWTSSRYAVDGLIVLGVVGFGFTVLRMPGLRVPRPITSIGLISYSLYIIHQNVGLVVIRELGSTLPDVTTRIALAMGAVVAIAWIMFITIEIRWQRPLADKIRGGMEWGFDLLPRRAELGR